MPQILCTWYFLEARGYGFDKNILYQNNISAMLLENNRNESSIKNETYQRPLLFYKRSGGNRGRGDLTLANGGNFGGPFHKYITRFTVQEVQGRNHEYTR